MKTRKLCPSCGKEMDRNLEDLFMVAIETPVYKNIYFHRSCYKEIGYENIEEFLSKKEEILN